MASKRANFRQLLLLPDACSALAACWGWPPDFCADGRGLLEVALPFFSGRTYTALVGWFSPTLELIARAALLRRSTRWIFPVSAEYDRPRSPGATCVALSPKTGFSFCPTKRAKGRCVGGTISPKGDQPPKRTWAAGRRYCSPRWLLLALQAAQPCLHLILGPGALPRSALTRRPAAGQPPKATSVSSASDQRRHPERRPFAPCWIAPAARPPMVAGRA